MTGTFSVRDPNLPPLSPLSTNHVHIPRRRLLHLVDKPFQAKLTAVIAPPGYGKTTAIAQWAADADHPVCWVSIPDALTSMDTLVHWMESWLSTKNGADSKLSTATDAITLTGSTLFEVGERIAQRHSPMTLVIDNAHHLPSQMLRNLLETLLILPGAPGNLSIILMSHSQSHRASAECLAAHGQLREITSEDLSFTTEEAAEVLRVSGSLQGSDSELGALITQGEGWIAGIMLTLHSIESPPRSHDMQEHAHVDEYIMRVVLEKLPLPMWPPLLASSWLPFLDAPTWQARHQPDSAPKPLAELLQLYPFLIPLGTELPQYRHHRLIQASMQRLTAALGPRDRLHTYLAHALTHLQATGYHQEALDIAVHIGDWDIAFDLVYAMAHDFALRDQHADLLRITERFPQKVLLQNDNMTFWVLLAHLSSGHIEQGRTLFNRIKGVWNDPDRPLCLGRYFICLALIQIFDGRRESALSSARRGLAVLPEDAIHERFRAAASMSVLAGHIGQADLALRMFEITRSYREQLPWDQEWWNVFVLPDQADHLALKGNLSDAIALYTHQLNTFPDLFRDRASLINLRLALIALEQDDRGRARALLDAIDRGEATSYWHLEVNLARAHLAWVDQDWPTAESIAVESIRQASRHQSRVETHRAETLLAQMWIDRGDLALARAWANRTSFATDRWPRTFGHLLPEVVLAHLLIAEGLPDQALSVTEGLKALGESRRQAGILVRVHAIEALAHTHQGNNDLAKRALQRAEEVGVAGGFVRSFLIGNVDTRSLQVVSLPINNALEQSLLSNREYEVLILMGKGLRNQEIANQLSISVYTVKSHLAHVYAKLGVRNRTEALTVARDLGLT